VATGHDCPNGSVRNLISRGSVRIFNGSVRRLEKFDENVSGIRNLVPRADNGVRERHSYRKHRAASPKDC
jgi:hypothetical protein